MSNPILAVAGDLHLSGTVYRSRLFDMKGDARYAAAQIADYCAANKLDLILAGDVMDAKRPESADVQALQNLVNTIDEVGCSVYGIQGQHDMSDPPWPEVVGATRLTSAPQKVGAGDGLVVIGLDYHPRGELLELLAEVPPCDLLILHQMLKESLGYTVEEEGSDGLVDARANYDVALEELPIHVKAVAAGDNHSGSYCFKKGYPSFSYTGSTHMRSINEPPKKRFLVVHDNLVAEKVPLDTRPFERFEVVTEEGLRDCLKEIRKLIEAPPPKARPPELQKPFVVIHFDTEVERVRERVMTACEDKAFCKLLPYQTVAQLGEETEVIQGSVTLEGCLDELVKPDDQPELNTFVRELLQVEDPRLVIAKTKDKYLQDTPETEAVHGGS